MIGTPEEDIFIDTKEEAPEVVDDLYINLNLLEVFDSSTLCSALFSILLFSP